MGEKEGERKEASKQAKKIPQEKFAQILFLHYLCCKITKIFWYMQIFLYLCEKFYSYDSFSR